MRIETQVQFKRTANGQYNYRISTLSYMYNLIEPVPMHGDVVRNADVHRIRSICRECRQNPYLVRIFSSPIKSRCGTSCVTYTYYE